MKKEEEENLTCIGGLPRYTGTLLTDNGKKSLP